MGRTGGRRTTVMPARSHAAVAERPAARPKRAYERYRRQRPGILRPLEALRPQELTVEGTPFTARELHRYARTLVERGPQLVAGDHLCLVADEQHRPLAEAIAIEAYEAGAEFVELIFEDEQALLERLADPEAEPLDRTLDIDRAERAIDNKAAFVFLRSAIDPQIAGLDDSSYSRMAELRNADEFDGMLFAKTFGSLERRWTNAIAPTVEWARQVYPEAATAEQAFQSLGDDLLDFSFAGAGDDQESATAHAQELKRRADALNDAGVRQLVFVDQDGRELEVGLLPGAFFTPVVGRDEFGNEVWVNWPSSEIFTTPDPAAVQGRFRSTKPFQLGNVLVTGVEGEIRGGQLDVASLRCDQPELLPLLRQYLQQEDGRLGEVALVDVRSRIGASGRVYGESTFDENAANHIAFGSSYGSMTVSEEARAAGVDGNRSDNHFDLMIGSEQMDVWGITESGERLLIQRSGRFVI